MGNQENRSLNYHPELFNIFSKGNVSGAVAGNLFAPIIITYFFYNIIPQTHMYTWMTLHVLIFASRMILRDKISNNLHLYTSIMAFSSLLYAAFAWMTLIYADDIHLLFAGVVISSIAAASMISLVAIFHIFASFVAIQTIGFITASFYNGQDIFYLSGVLGIVFLFFILLNGYKQFKTLKKEIKLKEQVNDLLDNAGQGFFSFTEDLKIEGHLSSRCKRLCNFGDIENIEISDMLFSGDRESKEQFIDGMNRLLCTDDESVREMFLSLLPKEQIINDRTIGIEYKSLKSNRFMVILTDITENKKLESELKYRSKAQDMVVAVASNKNDFMEVMDEFKEFTAKITDNDYTLESNIKNALRELHTFKGVFNQKNMLYTPAYIHKLELELKAASSTDELVTLLKSSYLEEIFTRDIDVINSILGKWFLYSHRLINVNVDFLDDIESRLISISDTLDKNNQSLLKDIITEVHRLKYRSVKRMLSQYISHVKDLSLKLDKEIYELEINGDAESKISPRFKPFMQSLIHLFNNCVDHGIEDIDTRLENSKDEVGTIKCGFQIVSDTLIIQIGDDGGGIDIEALSQKALDEGLKSEEELKVMSEEDKCKLIFTESLSTKEDITSISGVGVGMSAIKENLEKLNGKFNIENKLGSGVTFTFYLPLHSNNHEYIFNKDICESISNSITKQTELYLKDMLKLEIKDKKFIEEITIDKNYAQINFLDGFNGSVIMVFSSSVRKKLNSALIPSSFSKADKRVLVKEIPNEVLNTIAGLSLQDFDSSVRNVDISTPVHINSSDLTSIVQESKSKFIQEIETSIGSVISIVIEGEK